MSDIKAERQSPTATPTPLRKQEPTVSIWKQGGAISPDAALAKDKSEVRKPVGPGDKTAPGQ